MHSGPPPSGAPTLTDSLCTRCGLCCDGTLLGDVELAGRAEATRLEVLGVGVEDGGAGADVLPLPCPALRGTRCGIYTHRPGSCRTFECRLLQQTRRGTITVAGAAARIAAARRQVRRVTTLLAALESTDDQRLPLRERCMEALAVERAATLHVRRTRTRLQAAMSVLDETMHDTFLGAGPRRA